jgi:methylmalonyl-CoA epimerase
MGWRTDRERGAPSHLPRNPIIKPAIHHWDHVGLAMRDPRRAIELFRDVFGGQFIVGGDNLQIGIRSLVFKLPAKVKVEFLSPLYPDSYLAKYLEEHGEGFHHATLFVDDIVSTIQDLEAHGFETVDTKLDDSHWLETFLRPKSTFGCLIQVVQSDLDWYEPHPPLRRYWPVSGDGGGPKCGMFLHCHPTTPRNECADFNPRRDRASG